MLPSNQPADAKANLMSVPVKIYQSSIFSALLYTLAAFILGWSFGGPDVLGAESVFASFCTPIQSSRIFVGSNSYLLFILGFVVIFQFSPRPDAWLTKITQRAGILVAVVVLIASWLFVFLVFTGGSMALGCTLFSKDFSTIVLAGVLGGGFLQCMAAAVQPNPNSKREKRLLDHQKQIARQKAEELGLDPDEAAENTERIWNATGFSIGSVMEKAHGFVAAIAGGGIHGGLLFVLGAAFFIGLGFGVSGPMVALLYVIPLLIALADVLTILTFQILVQLVEDRKKPAWSAALSLPVAVLGMAYKAILVVVGAAALGALGGPDIPWPRYLEAAQTEPFGQGLTVTVILLMSLMWPLLLLIGPISSEFEQ